MLNVWERLMGVPFVIQLQISVRFHLRQLLLPLQHQSLLAEPHVLSHLTVPGPKMLVLPVLITNVLFLLRLRQP